MGQHFKQYSQREPGEGGYNSPAPSLTPTCRESARAAAFLWRFLLLLRPEALARATYAILRPGRRTTHARPSRRPVYGRRGAAAAVLRGQSLWPQLGTRSPR